MAAIMPLARAPSGPGDYLESRPMRLDKWLWAARCFKTRSLAAEAADLGRVQVNEQPAKPARELRVGDVVSVRIGSERRSLVVQGLSAVRGPAVVAQTLYAETPESRAAREQAAQERRLAPEPAAAASGRPTKRDRRARDQAGAVWKRWSASLDDS
jgi:ribosome-associated heat shock protein Hsp15